MATRTVEEMEVLVMDGYRAGEGGVRLARRLGIGTSTVYHVLSRHGVTRRTSAARPRRFTPEQERAIAARYAGGEMPSAIASDVGCSQILVRTIARRHDVLPSRGRGGLQREWTEEQRADMERRYLAGESQGAIAQRYHSSQPMVSRILRARGVSVGAKSGEAHGRWKGGRHVTGDGYVAVRVSADSPYASMRNQSGYVLEHRLVMAQKLGRPLTKEETVHHINGVRDHNQPENLQLRQGRHGKGEVLVCADCGSRNVVHAPLRSD